MLRSLLPLLAGTAIASDALIDGIVPCNVRLHGAKGDNKTEDTAAFTATLRACEGTGAPVVVPAGTYLIRPLQLPSGAHLVLQSGSTLAAWGDRYSWPNSTDKPCDFAREGSSCCLRNLPCCVPQKESLLWATNATNIKISGGGVIDGNAPHNDWHRGPSNISADGQYVSRSYGDYWHMCRPRMVEIRWSTGVVIENITIQNSIMFNVHTAHVTGLRIANVTINSLGPNTDGFNVAGTDMHIADSSVCNNDDCVPVNAPTNGLLVERVNCICKWGGGFVPMIGDKDTSWGADCRFIGGGKTRCSPRGDIVNVTFRDSIFNHTSTAIIMKSMPVFEGAIRNVTYENLRLYNVRTGVCINTGGQSCVNKHEDGGWDIPTSLATEVGAKVMNVDGITIRNITGINVELAGYLNCPRGNCTAVALHDVAFHGAMPYFCDGSVRGESTGCDPPTCPLNASDASVLRYI